MKYIGIVVSIAALLLSVGCDTIAASKHVEQIASEFSLSAPGILPDRRLLYKLNTLQNVIIMKLLINDDKRVEFELLMADKTLYASALLMEKGNASLAVETALKGENYFSMLAADYNEAYPRISKELNARIDRAYLAHQEILAYLIAAAPESDKKTLRDVDYFSKTNYQTIQKIRNQNTQ